MTKSILLSLLLIALAAGAGGYLIGRVGHEASGSEEQDADADSKPQERVVASVQVVPVRRTALTPTVRAFGSVVAQPGEVKVLSVPFESRVARVRVIPGQKVDAGTNLIEIEPSPETFFLLNEADRVAAASTLDLDQVQRRFDARLATNQELFLARQNLESAKLKAQSLRDRGAGGPQRLSADRAGVVSKFAVQEGQIVPAGGGLVEVAPVDRFEVRLGLEPQDAASIEPGLSVKLRDASGEAGAIAEGQVRLVTRKVDPDTRAVEAYVSIPKNFDRPLDASIVAEISGKPKTVLCVPRAAVMPGATGQTLFTISNFKAVEHKVSIGIRSEGWVEVQADDLKEGDMVVVAGGAELESGMRVSTTSAAPDADADPKDSDEPHPTSRPSTTEAAS